MFGRCAWSSIRPDGITEQVLLRLEPPKLIGESNGCPMRVMMVRSEADRSRRTLLQPSNRHCASDRPIGPLEERQEQPGHGWNRPLGAQLKK